MDIWLVWLRDGEYGDTNLMNPAHRTRSSAMAWCNENRKLEGGDPIKWEVSRGADPVDYGESQHIVLDLGRTKHRTTRFYSLQVMKLDD
jgi:hypothetical protein